MSVPSGGTATVSYSVNCNAPPVVNAGPDQTAVTGLLYTLQWSFTDANHNGPWTYTINWGDGSTSTGTVSSEGTFSKGHTRHHSAAELHDSRNGQRRGGRVGV